MWNQKDRHVNGFKSERTEDSFWADAAIWKS